MKFSARRAARRGRTSRSPRMSCSLMMAAFCGLEARFDARAPRARCRPSAAPDLRPGADERAGWAAHDRRARGPCARASLRSRARRRRACCAAAAPARAWRPRRTHWRWARRARRRNCVLAARRHRRSTRRFPARRKASAAPARALKPRLPFRRRSDRADRAAAAYRDGAAVLSERVLARLDNSRRSAQGARARRLPPCGSSTTGEPGTIVEQRIEPLVKQRQPMLHAGMAAAFADRFIEQIVARRRAESRDIAGAELADGVRW